MIKIEELTNRQRKLMKPNELIGKKFGKLNVICIEYLKKPKNEAFYKCVCDCGNYVLLSGTILRRKKVHSCHDCNMERIHNLAKTHGMSNATIYKIYRSMLSRCNNKNHKAYINYGGRGIKVCDEWKNNFQNFYKWAIKNGWKEIKNSKNYSVLTIDRIDPDGNYEPSNCRFITMKEQQNNKRTNHLIEYNGEYKNITQWCKELKLNRNTVYGQINYQHLTLKEIIERN